eukprot:2314079-Amphidinium_carterae.1
MFCGSGSYNPIQHHLHHPLLQGFPILKEIFPSEDMSRISIMDLCTSLSGKPLSFGVAPSEERASV